MARFRSIEPQLWDNAELRRLGMVPRMIFLFLFSKWADDEGRFKVDLFSILEGAFSRADPVTEDDVNTALTGLSDTGMVLLYGEAGEYGWLTGWYCHQKIDKRIREVSALPEPPTLIASWEEADRVRIAYARTGGQKEAERCSFRDAIRWHTAQSRVANEGSTRDVRVKYALEGGGGEGKGLKGQDQDSTPTQADAPPNQGESVNKVLTKCSPEENRSTASTPTPTEELESMGKSLTPQQLALNAAWSACGLDGMPTNPGRKKPISRFMGIIKRKGLEQVGAWAGLREGKPLVVPAGADPIEHFWDVFLNDMEQPWRWGWDEEGQCLKQAGGVGGTGRQPQLSDSQEEAGRVWADIPEDALGDQS